MDRLDQRLSSSTTRTAPRASGATSSNSPYNRSSRSFAADNDKSQVNEVKPTGKLTIENLHWDVSEQDLKALFEQIGPVTKAYIKYDRSDRSTGVAVVVYQDPNHALQAKNEYDGAKAKGQVISITQEMRADRPKRVQGQHRSLLSRFDLSSRLKGDGAETSEAGVGNRFADRLGPVRNGGRSGRGETKRGARMRTAPAKREKRKPVTAADLDAELEAFMNAPSNLASTPDTAAAAGHPNPAKVSSDSHTDDVEMM